MSMDVAEKLEQVLREDLSVRASQITRDALLVDDLGIDSVGFALGLVVIEEKLGVALSEDQLLVCNSFGDLVDIVSSMKNAGSAPVAEAKPAV
ncbi:phosphopantetheine-binding protein [Segniliparus rotundus DSM 44985]|uniref:Phosphopantetheine-binding protein n=1 Tax=Segniliparus rotundus (strain ATCC BAA-972 / CDC 1076 / CIP 108378 / DSM 44985 / JCM 13578) TaxID=640132 RepID=D6ZBA6_SEGRD|nr:acyl carrier protein [Segniliparus rotundus]ADG96865.1 phosphopantetheine-binding protein [Segniliparus rotundus DSM 44985]